MSWPTPVGKLTLRDVTLFAVLGAMTFGAKYAMAALPNIEPVSLMVMVFGAVFGKKAVWPVFIYVAMEFLFYGLGIWNIMYLYIWPLLALTAWLLRELRQSLGWAVLSGAFGLLFGLLCAPVDAAVGGRSYAAAKWISGIPFDIVHCLGNFFLALALFVPLRNLTEKLYRRR